MSNRAAPFKNFNVLPWVLAVVVSLSACRNRPETTVLDRIITRGEIVVITRNNPWCYYLYRDQPEGFEYELARAFADRLGVSLKVRVARSWEQMIPDLLAGKGDFIAADMAMTPERRTQAAFSQAYLSSEPYVIVRRGSRRIQSLDDLAGETIHVARGTSYQERLKALQASGLSITIALHRGLETSELIRMVADRTIDMTVADHFVAALTQRYYPWIDLAVPIGKSESSGWAVDPKAGHLLSRINTFFTTIRQNGEFDRIYNRHFSGLDDFDFVDLRAYHREIKKTLPAYRGFIEEIADRFGFDWRLIAAQIYQESRFNPQAVSRRDAHGLMQITLKTAEDLGVVDIYDACQNVEAGVRHLKDLFEFYDHARGEDRLWIALAAYNVGVGHLLDARNIAREQGLNPEKWSSLQKTLPLLAKPEYYQKAQYGYCRGTEPVAYINKINLYYSILKFQDVVARM